MIKNKNSWRGTPRYTERRQALGLSPRLPKGGLRQGKEVTPYGK